MTEKHADQHLIDDKVSEAYQHTRAEQPPAALDAAIRREARDALASPRTPRWLLPLAYAATLALAVSIVLEVQAPLAPAEDAFLQEDSVTTPADFAAPVTVRGEAMPAGKPTAPRADSASEEPSLRQRETATPAAATLPAAAPAAATPRGTTSATAAPPESAPAAKVAGALTDGAAEVRRETAAGQETASTLAAERAALSVTPARAAASAPTDTCPAAERETAANWLACIEALDAEGKHDRAEAERAAFRQAFPDYASPP